MWFLYVMIGNVLWSVSDVVGSMIMNRMERSSILVAWFFSILQFLLLGMLYFLLPIQPVWTVAFAVTGLCSYIASLLYMRLLQDVDVSISSISWVFLSLGIALGSVMLFGDRWTLLQALGAVLSVSGSLWLALWHKRVSRFATLILIIATGLFYVPSFLLQKAAYLHGVSVANVFFWQLLFFDSFAFIIPLIIPSHRKHILPFLGTVRPFFVVFIIAWVLMSMLAFIATTNAFMVGDASLVAIAENGQPFFIMLFAWIATFLSPKYAPKEILTAQTMPVKIVSFFIVFIGLTLLAIP